MGLLFVCFGLVWGHSLLRAWQLLLAVHRGPLVLGIEAHEPSFRSLISVLWPEGEKLPDQGKRGTEVVA